MFLEAIVGAVVGGIAGYYLGTQRELFLKPNLSLDYGKTAISEVKQKVADFVNSNLYSNKGVYFKNESLLSFIGTVHKACEDNNFTNTELLTVLHFTTDSGKLNVVLVPAFINGNGDIEEFNSFASSGVAARDLTSANPTISLMNKSSCIPPPHNISVFD